MIYCAVDGSNTEKPWKPCAPVSSQQGIFTAPEKEWKPWMNYVRSKALARWDFKGSSNFIKRRITHLLLLCTLRGL